MLRAAVVLSAAVLWMPATALAQCAPPVTANQVCTNPAGSTIEPLGIIDTGSPSVTNFGTILGGNVGVFGLQNAFVVNSGTIRGDFNAGVMAQNGNAVILNSGTISGGGYGIFAGNNAVVSNSGAIVATSPSAVAAIFAVNAVYVTNSGVISGRLGITANGDGSVITNSGIIIGTDGTAIDLSFAANNTLNFLPGSRVVGFINLGLNDSVTVQGGPGLSSLLTFGCGGCGGLTDTGSTARVTGGAPYAISGDRIAVLDPTALGMADRTLMDFTGQVSAMIGSRMAEFAAAGPGPGSATAFAPAGSRVADTASAAFASVPNAATVDRASGVAVWSKTFAGIRRQRGDDAMLGSTGTSHGGMLGIDAPAADIGRFGAFLGAGRGRLGVDLGSQSVSTDYVFGGLYGRFDWGAQFIDITVTAGRSSNETSRLITDNLAPNGLAAANASYNGWFASPEFAYGVRMPMAGGFTLTPAVRLRYLAGNFGGYTESGSAQTLSVASRTVQNLEQRAELALSHTSGSGGLLLKTTARAGVLGMERLGGKGINAVLIGQGLAFGAAGKDASAGLYAGLGFDYRIAPRVALFAAAEGTVMSDRSTLGTVQGGLRYAF